MGILEFLGFSLWYYYKQHLVKYLLNSVAILTVSRPYTYCIMPFIPLHSIFMLLLCSSKYLWVAILFAFSNFIHNAVSELLDVYACRSLTEFINLNWWNRLSLILIIFWVCKLIQGLFLSFKAFLIIFLGVMFVNKIVEINQKNIKFLI